MIRIRCLSLLLSLIGACLAGNGSAWSYPAGPSGHYIIKAINIKLADRAAGKANELQIRNIIPIREGDVFDPERLDKALDLLRKWGIFETISAETMPKEDGIEINLSLKEAVLIGEIDISGNYPLVEQRVRKYLTIRPGDIYTRERVEEQTKKIADLYEREGFYNTLVTVSESWSDYTLDANVSYKIKRGPLLRYGNIEIEGMKAYPKGRLVSAINPLKRYKERSFNEAIRETENFYHTHGYPRAKIDVLKKDLDLERRRVDVSIMVNEGPKVDAVFRGNKEISSKKLRKVITIFDEGSFDDFEIDASKEALTGYYRMNGFDQVVVSAKRMIRPDGSIEIAFDIVEGAKRKIASISFDGNESIPSGRLRKKMSSKETSLTDRGIYNEESFEKDLKNLRAYYESEGFLNARIDTPVVNDTREGLDITIPVVENGRTIVIENRFYGNENIPSKNLIRKLRNRADKPLNIAFLEEDRRTVGQYFIDHGYPYVDVKQSIETKDGRAVIRYDISEGPLVRIGEIFVVGNSLTATKSIKNSIPIREGDPYSYKKIVEGQLGLRRMGAFNSVKIEPLGLAEHEKVVHLKISVEEQKPFILDLEVGYSTDQLLTTTLNFTNLNTFGMAKRSNFMLTGGQRLSRAEVNWIDPRFYGSDLEMTTSAWLQYQNTLVYSYVQGGGGFGFFRRYHRTGVMAKYDITRNYFIQGDSTAADADSLRNNTLSKLALSVSYDTRDNFADPKRGINAMAGVALNDEIKGAGSNFLKYKLGGSQYLSFLNFVFFNTLRFGTIETIGTNVSVPSNELFLMGGADTMRGFSEDSLGPTNAAGKATGGRTRIIYNGELNMRVFGNFKLAGFCDIGTLVNDFDQIGWYSTVRKSAGFGLRYMTPVGPMRFDYGIILDRKPGENFGRFHFMFGFLF